MKVLVSTKKSQGQRKNDFCWLEEGEPLGFGTECDGERVDGSCGCRRSMVGLVSGFGTTTFVVQDQPELSEEAFAEQVFSSLKAAGFVADDPEGHERAAADAQELVRLAAAFAVDRVLEKRGRQIQTRALVRPR